MNVKQILRWLPVLFCAWLHASESNQYPQPTQTIDLNKINSSKEKLVSFSAVDARIKSIESHIATTTKELNELKEFLEDIKEDIRIQLDKTPSTRQSIPTPTTAPMPTTTTTPASTITIIPTSSQTTPTVQQPTQKEVGQP